MAKSKSVKKVNTKKRKSMSVDELRAYKTAYGGTLGARDYITFVGIPAGLFGFFSFLLLYNVWVTAVCFVIGLIYGVRVLLPKSIKKQYESEGFRQRNRFLNNITQVLTDDNKTVLMSIKKVTIRVSGQFRDDLEQFHAMLIGADADRIREAVNWFGKRYDDDIIFMQYLEQLETAMLEGKTNIETLKDIKTYHNDILQKQQLYERQKAGHLNDMRTLVIITAILIVSLAVSFGFETYLRAFARHIVGYISAGLYLSLMVMFFRQFVGYLFDDSVLEIRKS